MVRLFVLHGARQHLHVEPVAQLQKAPAFTTHRDPPLIPGEVSAQAGELHSFAAYDLRGRNVFLALRANL